jgi:hypothetical protein
VVDRRQALAVLEAGVDLTGGAVFDGAGCDVRGREALLF